MVIIITIVMQMAIWYIEDIIGFERGVINMSNKKILVLYYSRTGTLRKVAGGITINLNCDMEEIIDTKNRKGIIGFISAGRTAMTEKLTEILPIKSDLTKYDLVVIGTPVWAGKVSTATRTFLVQNADKIKEVAVFCASGGAGKSKVVSIVEEITGKKVTGVLEISGKDFKDETYINKIKKFTDGL